MELKHVGLNIYQEDELIDFYQNVLGFHFEYQFEMAAELCNTLFGVDKPIKAFLYKKEDTLLELFVNPVNAEKSFSHICLAVNDRDSMAAKCKVSNYPVVRIDRVDRPDILFLKDKTGNIFEIKDI